MAESGDQRGEDIRKEQDGMKMDPSFVNQLSELSSKFNENSCELNKLVERLNQGCFASDEIKSVETKKDTSKELLKKKDEEIKKLKAALQGSGNSEQKSLLKARDKEINKLKDENKKLKKELAERDEKDRVSAPGAQPLPAGSDLQTPIFKRMKKNESLSQFIARELNPDKTFNKQLNEIIDKLVKIMQHSPLKIKRTFKAGSLAKGTHIRNKSDIDLIIFFNNYERVQDLKGDKEKLLLKLQELIAREWSSEDLIFKERTPMSLQFYIKLEGHDNQHELDLLPAVDITQDKNYTLQSIYEEMKDLPNEDRADYSSSFSQLQVNFVQATDKVPTPGRAKDLIRLLKNWAKDENVPLGSYVFELLVIYHWRNHDKPSNINIEEYLRLILRQLSNLKTMSIAFDDNYCYTDYKDYKPPFLLDPVNPFQNLLQLSKPNIDHVERKAKMLLESGW